MSGNIPASDPRLIHEQNGKMADKILVFGIVSLFLGIAFFPALVGLVMGIVNLISANKSIRQTGPLYLKARIGKYLSVGAIVVGSVCGIYSLLVYAVLISSVIRNLS